MNREEAESFLADEICLISRRERSSIDLDRSLGWNGINSLGFVDLLLAVKEHCGCDFLSQSLSPADTASIRALARKISETV